MRVDSPSTCSGRATADQAARNWRRDLPAALRQRSLVKGLGVASIYFALYIGLFYGAFLFPNVWCRIAAAFAQMFVLGGLMVLAHDACHQSLTPIPWLNRLIGRIAFLPLYHPYTSWVHSHNWLHHGHTNLKGMHPDFAPMSVKEYAAASLTRKLREQIYRSPFGVGFCYLIEYWLLHLWIPRGKYVPRHRTQFFFDRLLVLGFFIGQVLLGATLASLTPNRTLPVSFLLLAMIVFPWIVSMLTIGIVSYVLHTHPTIAWYQDKSQWQFFEAQIRSSVHITMPSLLDGLVLNIMDHSAHHIDPSIPLYHLRAGQQILEEQANEHTNVIPWSLSEFFRTCRVCKLYDFQEHRWVDFQGNPTTENLLPRLSTPTNVQQ